MGNVKKYVAERTRHQRQYDRRVNKRQMQTSENDTDADDADIRPIYDEQPMAEYTGKCQVKSPLLNSSPDNKTTEFSNQSLESENIFLKKTVTQFQKDFSRMEAHCIALELKYQNQALKSGQHGYILNEISNKAKIKKEIDAYETINIELEHSMAKLLTENEHLNKENETIKKHYKDLYDSIKITRSKTIEHTTYLLANNANLKAQIQEKVFAIASLKNELQKLKGNSVDTKFTKTSVLWKPVLQSLINQSVVRQSNAFKSERHQILKPWFASQVDVKNDLSKPVTQHCLPKRRESAFVKPDQVIASRESRNSSKNMPRFSSNDMVHNHYLEEARKKTQKEIGIQNLVLCILLVHKTLLKVVPTGKILASCTSKDDSESTNGSNVDILNIYKCKQTLNLSACTLINVQKEQGFDLSAADTIVMKSMIELESLFGPLFDEYVNGENQVVSKSSVVTTADASDKRQQQPDSTSSTSTLATTVTVDGNFDM
ncbi:hypothetical protein Tco_0667405 [Tanacetum coccineum]